MSNQDREWITRSARRHSTIEGWRHAAPQDHQAAVNTGAIDDPEVVGHMRLPTLMTREDILVMAPNFRDLDDWIATDIDSYLQAVSREWIEEACTAAGLKPIEGGWRTRDLRERGSGEENYGSWLESDPESYLDALRHGLIGDRAIFPHLKRGSGDPVMTGVARSRRRYVDTAQWARHDPICHAIAMRIEHSRTANTAVARSRNRKANESYRSRRTILSGTYHSVKYDPKVALSQEPDRVVYRLAEIKGSVKRSIAHRKDLEAGRVQHFPIFKDVFVVMHDVDERMSWPSLARVVSTLASSYGFKVLPGTALLAEKYVVPMDALHRATDLELFGGKGLEAWYEDRLLRIGNILPWHLKLPPGQGRDVLRLLMALRPGERSVYAPHLFGSLSEPARRDLSALSRRKGSPLPRRARILICRDEIGRLPEVKALPEGIVTLDRVIAANAKSSDTSV